MPKKFEIIAIIGPTASGKSDIALELAIKLQSSIFSLDSLAIFRDFDIAAAKVSDTRGIKHYALSVMQAECHINAMTFIELLQDAIKEEKAKGASSLIICGGSSFYLKTIIEGISHLPTLEGIEASPRQMLDALKAIDSNYNTPLEDSYRLERDFAILRTTGLSPRGYFANNPKKRYFDNVDFKVFALEMERGILRDRIEKRTRQMLQNGLIEEIRSAREKYPKTIQAFRAIGVKETLKYLEDSLNLQELELEIFHHTAQFAKRQVSFNRTQFRDISYFRDINSLLAVLD